jgi:hypothetical protein
MSSNPVNSGSEKPQTETDQKYRTRDSPPSIAAHQSEIKNPHANGDGSRPADKESPPQYSTNDKIIANWTRVLGVSTIFLFLATAGTGYILHSTDVTLSRQLSIMEAQLAATEREQQPRIVSVYDDEAAEEPSLAEFPKGSQKSDGISNIKTPARERLETSA